MPLLAIAKAVKLDLFTAREQMDGAGGRGDRGGYVKFNMSFTNSQDVKTSAERKRAAAEGRRWKGSLDTLAAAANRCEERAQETGMKRPIYDKTGRR